MLHLRLASVFCLSLLLGAISGQATQPPPSPSDLLQRVRSRLLADMGRQSRYTCAQNIVRRFYRSDSKQSRTCTEFIARQAARKHDPPLTSWDHLQLDVAIADNREIHSWPGAPKFAEDEIRGLVGNQGPFGSGDFAAFVVGVFGGPASVKFESRHSVEGHTLFEYTFAVAESASNYRIADSGGIAATAYSGSFLLDPQTEDLVQLTVRTAELPEATYACQAVSEIEYERIGIHGHDVLAPRETVLRTIYRDGTEAAGVTSYSGCHEYTGTSVLRFDITDLGTAAAAPPPAASPVPSGLFFDCRIVTPIDSETPAGRPIEALLSAPLRGQDGAILAPIGARIRGRLVRVAEYKTTRHYFEINVRLDSVEVNGSELPLYAALAHDAAPPVDASARNDRGVRFSDLPMLAQRNIGVFLFAVEHLHIQQLDSRWLTIAPEVRSEIGKETQAEALGTTLQVSEKEAAQEFIRAIHYSQQASDLLNETPPAGSLADDPRLPEILTYRRKAIEVGKSADRDVLNNLYPELGDEFKDKFLEGLALFVHGCEMRSKFEGAARGELSRSVLLMDEWTAWYKAHSEAVENAVNLRELGPK